MVCFNCGKTGHKVGDNICKLPIDQKRIDNNKAKYVKTKNDHLNATDSRWKPPTNIEAGKRLIGGNPFTFNIPKNKWIQDITPPTGLAAAAPVVPDIVPQPFPPIISPVPPVIETTGAHEPSDDITTASTVAQLQVQMAAIQRKLASVQDSMG